MRLLYLAYRLPYPPDKGERIRALGQLRQLAGHGEVHLVCPVSGQPAATSLEALRRHCASITAVREAGWLAPLREAGRLLAGAPRMTGTFSSPGLRRAAREVVRAHALDRILVSTLHVADAACTIPDVPKVIDLVDVYSESWLALARYQRHPMAWLSRLEGRRLRRYEARLAATFDRVILASSAEARLFRERVAQVPVAVVGNGVDLDYFRPAEGDPPAARPTVVFTGSMDYAANADAVSFFARRVLPLLRDRHPAVCFTVVGRSPTRSVRALAALPGVRVTGTVVDVREYLRTASVAVVPLRVARGIQNKVLEAMAMGVPVVATSAALAGLEPTFGEGARRADDAESFVRELDALLRDPGWRRHCAAAARAYVERYHRWEEHGARLLRVLEDSAAPA